MTVTHFDVLPALSTTRTHKRIFVVLSRTERDVALGFEVGTSVTRPFDDVFTCTFPMPEFLSVARTVIRTPPRAAAAVTADGEEDVDVAVAPDIVGAVVSRMMSSWYGVDALPSLLTNFT